MGAWAVEQLEQQAVMDQQRFQDGFAGYAMFWSRFGPEIHGSFAEAPWKLRGSRALSSPPAVDRCPITYTILHNQSQSVSKQGLFNL